MVSKSTTTQPDATVKPLPTAADTLQAEKDQLAQDMLKIQARQADLMQKEELAREQRRNVLFVELDKAREAAANFRREARATADPDEKRNLYEWAGEADREVQQLEVELGIAAKADADEPATVLPWMQRNKKVMALLQVLGVLALIQFCYGQFMAYKDQIDAINKTLPFDQHLQPYDLTSIQKFFYEQLVVFTSLPIALAILFLVVPFVGFYVLPFLKSRKDFYSEFYEDLTPWQRTVISTALLLGLLFFLAISHTVKP
ncbi:hypothetical protein [Larkinella sp. C7]|jgi:hypothetical protein|uniref:hypothetical protein n=1 Tax=Larkinella sp. C7 TaxID=2576607 RepID=UPI0011114096|nr:hypothetical protein [Larkinella sp. C7]